MKHCGHFCTDLFIFHQDETGQYETQEINTPTSGLDWTLVLEVFLCLNPIDFLNVEQICIKIQDLKVRAGVYFLCWLQHLTRFWSEKQNGDHNNNNNK